MLCVMRARLPAADTSVTSTLSYKSLLDAVCKAPSDRGTAPQHAHAGSEAPDLVHVCVFCDLCQSVRKGC
jgi:hypothetical protein